MVAVIIPPSASLRNTDGANEVIVGTAGFTVMAAPLKAQPVASLGAVQPEPEIMALPWPAPVTVSPLMVTIPDGVAEKIPPVHPEGAVAALVPPTIMVVGLTVTAPVGQLGGGGVMTVLPPPPQEEMNPAAAHNNESNVSFLTEKPPCRGFALRLRTV
jgi:hypothetical protein